MLQGLLKHAHRAWGLCMAWRSSCVSCWDGLKLLMPPAPTYWQQPEGSDDGSASPSPPIQTLAECLIPPSLNGLQDFSVHSRAALLTEPSGASVCKLIIQSNTTRIACMAMYRQS